MKTLLRLIKRSLPFRLFKRLCYWAYTPTPEERLKWMYSLGKFQGRREALKELPITAVQPKQQATSAVLNLPPGVYTRNYREELLQSGQHPSASRVLRRIGSAQPTKVTLPETTEEMPAVVKLLHERSGVTRKLG